MGKIGVSIVICRVTILSSLCFFETSLVRSEKNRFLRESSKGSLTIKKRERKKYVRSRETCPRDSIYGDFIAISSHKAGMAIKIIGQVTSD